MMKKLLYFFLPLLAFVACEDNGGDGLKDKSPLSTLTSVSNFNPNGEAAIVETSSDGASVTLKYEVIPASCATVLSEQWENYVTLQALYSNSEEIDFVEMPISEVVADEDNGIITVTASGENLSTEFYSGLIEASCRFIISDNNKEVRSDYRKLTCSRWSAETLPSPQSNEIYYTASDVVSSKMKDVVSNVYDYTKGYYTMTFQNPITEIRDYAFKECRNLTSITIPNSVTEVRHQAFYDCSSLKSVTLGSGVTEIGQDAFYKCSNIKNVYITDINAWMGISFDTAYSNPLYYGANLYLNDSLVTDLTISDNINNYTFIGCISLQNVILSDGVKRIGVRAFTGCTCEVTISTKPSGLSSSGVAIIKISDGITELPCDAFYGCTSLTSVTIPNSVTTIGESAFEGCTGLTNVIIPGSVTTIGEKAFYSCSSLTSITIPDSVTTIGNYTFSSCSSLTSITIPDSVTTIGIYAFQYCSSLTSITIPDSVTTIGKQAFYGCKSLTSITIPEGVTEIQYATFSNCSSLTSVTIPDSVTKIGPCGFEGCSSLKRITIPEGVTEIQYATFSNCSSLTSVTIPDSVTKIGPCGFEGCSSLKRITIPEGVTEIGDKAFLGTGKMDVYCKPTIVPELIPSYNFAFGGYEWHHFNSVVNKIYVPTGSVDAYKTAEGWKEYADVIVGYDFNE